MECAVENTMCVWKLEDNLLEWVFSFYHVGSWEDSTQVLSFVTGAFIFEAISEAPVLLANAVLIGTNLIIQMAWEWQLQKSCVKPRYRDI